MVVFPCPCFPFRSLVGVVPKVTICVPEKRTANIRRITIGSHMLAIKTAPADHDTQVWFQGPTLCNIWIWHFIMGGILRLYQAQGLFIICAPDADVTDDSHCDSSLTAGHTHKKNLSFNLVKVLWFISSLQSFPFNLFVFYVLLDFQISIKLVI